MMTATSLLTLIMIKPALVVTCCATIAWVCRRRSAATRHAIWTGCVVAICILPVLAAVVPALAIRTAALESFRADRRPALPSSAKAFAPNGNELRAGATRGPLVTHTQFGFDEGAVLLWGVIALTLFARRLAAEVVVRRIVAASHEPPPHVVDRARSLARALQIRQPVRLVVSDRIASPAVAGIRSSVIMLPAGAAAWSDTEMTDVLVHELSHVRRRDCAMNLLADVAAAIQWCNPMVHLAARRLRAESEHACDDAVLERGAAADAYAQLLLTLAHRAHIGSGVPRAASAMARASELESRLIAVLDSRQVRTSPRPVLRRALTATATLLGVPIAALTLVAATPPFQIAGIEPDRLGDSLAAQSSERVPVDVDLQTVRAAAARALAGPDSALAAVLLTAAANPQPGALVAERAAWALLQTKGNRMLDAIRDSLGSRDWRVQAYAAWTVAVAGDAASVPALIRLMRHPVWRVRAMAAASIAYSADPRAVDAMTAALTDPAWQVRSEAVAFLGAVDLPAQRERIRERLSDRHIAVRLAAARVLRNP